MLRWWNHQKSCSFSAKKPFYRSRRNIFQLTSLHLNLNVCGYKVFSCYYGENGFNMLVMKEIVLKRIYCSRCKIWHAVISMLTKHFKKYKMKHTCHSYYDIKKTNSLLRLYIKSVKRSARTKTSGVKYLFVR